MGEVGRLSLFVILADQGNDSNNDQAEWKNSFPCNIHSRHPLSLRLGAKEGYHPRKDSRGTAYRGTGSTEGSITRLPTNCRGKPENSGEMWKSPTCSQIRQTGPLLTSTVLFMNCLQFLDVSFKTRGYGNSRKVAEAVSRLLSPRRTPLFYLSSSF